MSGRMRIWGVLAAVLGPGILAAGSAAAAEPNINRFGGDYASFNQRTNDPRECEAACAADRACRAWTSVRPGIQGPSAKCWLKNVIPAATASACCTSGVKAPRAVIPARVVDFCFSAYGDPERPFPGYVGPWQLGRVSIQGRGAVRSPDGALVSGGLISHTDALRDPRYPYHATTWQVVRALSLQRTGARTVLRLQVRVIGSNLADICPVGTSGAITLIDDKSPMANGQTNDGVGMEAPNPLSRAPDGGLACRTHTHGMNNSSVSWTDPPFGGRGGGMWATVSIGRPCGGRQAQPPPSARPPPHQSGGMIADPPQ